MKIFRFVLVSSIIILLNSCLSVPKNDNKGGATVYVRISGVSTNYGLSVGDFEYPTYFIGPTKLSPGDSILVSTLQTKYALKRNFKKGTFDEWTLGGRRKGETKGGYFIVDSQNFNVLIKENSFTILPFKLEFMISKQMDNSVYYQIKMNLVKLNERDLAEILKDMKANDNVKSYQAIYLGDQDITDRIKN